MRSYLRVGYLLALSFVSAAGYALGQPVTAPQEWGQGPNVLQIPASSFLQTSLATEWGSRFYLWPNSSSAAELRASVILPSGANIFQMGLWYYDISASDVTAELWAAPPAPADPVLIGSVASGSVGGFGYASLENLNYTVHNDVANDLAGAHLFVIVKLPADAQVEAAFRGVEIRYLRLVSPPPPTATFNDVPTDHPLFQFVEALARSEITAGCGGGNYCPDAPLTRGQMAVFLSKALGLYWQ